MVKTKLAPAFLAVTLLVGGFTAAGQAKKVTLRFAHWGFNPGIDLAIKKWNKLNPNIQVTPELIDWGGYFQKIPVEIAAGSPPDMFSELLVNGKFEPLVKKGVIRDLTPWFKSDFNINDMFPAAIQAASLDNKIWAMPAGISNQGFIAYNINFFEQRGLTLPDKNWDLNDFTEAAKKLSRDANGDGKPDQWGFQGAGFRFDEIYGAGGKVYNEGGTKMLLDSPENNRILKWHQDLYLQYKVIGGSYANGTAAMMYGPPQWILDTLRLSKKGFKTGVTFWPKDPVTGLRRFEPDPWHICIPRNSKHQAEAWKFLKWFNTKDAHPLVSRDAFGTSQLMPPLKSVARSDVYLKPDPKMLPSTLDMSVFVEGIDKYTVSTPYVNNGFDIRNMLGSYFGNVLSGKMSVQQFITKATAEGNQLLNRKRK